MNTSLFDQVRQLSVEEQIELVEALWDNIVEPNAVPERQYLGIEFIAEIERPTPRSRDGS
jgi:putative addiction module component (TIGR02574 family)